MRIEVVAAVTSREWSAEIECEDGSTVRGVIELAKQLDAFADAALDEADGLAIWGEQVSLDHVLCPGDRVEVLRKLRQAPMEMRRAQAREGKPE